MTLEDHIRAGGAHSLTIDDDGKVQCPEHDRCRHFPFRFWDQREEGAAEPRWACPVEWEPKMRAVVAFAEAMKPDDTPWDVLRRREYMKAWPIPAQLEAQNDLLAGDRTKFDLMQADFAAIKERIPKPKGKPA